MPLTPDYPAFVEFTLINCTSTGDGFTFFTDTYMTYTTLHGVADELGRRETSSCASTSPVISSTRGAAGGSTTWRVSHTLVPGTCAPRSPARRRFPTGPPCPACPCASRRRDEPRDHLGRDALSGAPPSTSIAARSATTRPSARAPAAFRRPAPRLSRSPTTPGSSSRRPTAPRPTGAGPARSPARSGATAEQPPLVRRSRST